MLAAMAEHGLRAARTGCEVYVMCEIPTNVILAEEFAELFDGFSIGSNDLTQLTLGVDRDSAIVASLFDERDPAREGDDPPGDRGAHRNRRAGRHLRPGAVGLSRSSPNSWWSSASTRSA